MTSLTQKQARTQSTVAPPDPKAISASLVQVSTLVIWVFCLAIGMAGLLIPYSRPQVRPPEPPPVIAEVLNVQLTREPLPPAVQNTQPVGLLAPPPVDPLVMPPAPPELVPVAEPSAAIAFALPVEGPSRVVDAAQAGPAARQEPAVAPAVSLPVQAITYGEGEGRQPAPEYPRRAVREGQEGLVRVRFSVATDGRVVSAQIATPSPWPLLNDAAVQVVRNRWRFRQGPQRLYEVGIRFELTK